MDPRKLIFDAVRQTAKPGLFNDPGNILALNNLLDAFEVPRENMTHELRSPKAFYDAVRKITGSLNQTQVVTIDKLLSQASRWSTAWLAYGLATAWHECRLEPIDEWGKGKGRPYAKPGARMKALPNAPTYGGQIPYGRGLVQLTWCDNYEWADKIAAEAGLTQKGEILKNFELVKRPDIATLVLIKGMETGAFTGKKLGDYLGERGTEVVFRSARKIINGTDKADLIAGHAVKFEDALDQGAWG